MNVVPFLFVGLITNRTGTTRDGCHGLGTVGQTWERLYSVAGGPKLQVRGLGGLIIKPNLAYVSLRHRLDDDIMRSKNAPNVFRLWPFVTKGRDFRHTVACEVKALPCAVAKLC